MVALRFRRRASPFGGLPRIAKTPASTRSRSMESVSTSSISGVRRSLARSSTIARGVLPTPRSACTKTTRLMAARTAVRGAAAPSHHTAAESSTSRHIRAASASFAGATAYKASSFAPRKVFVDVQEPQRWCPTASGSTHSAAASDAGRGPGSPRRFFATGKPAGSPQSSATIVKAPRLARARSTATWPPCGKRRASTSIAGWSRGADAEKASSDCAASLSASKKPLAPRVPPPKRREISWFDASSIAPTGTTRFGSAPASRAAIGASTCATQPRRSSRDSAASIASRGGGAGGVPTAPLARSRSTASPIQSRSTPSNASASPDAMAAATRRAICRASGATLTPETDAASGSGSAGLVASALSRFCSERRSALVLESRSRLTNDDVESNRVIVGMHSSAASSSSLAPSLASSLDDEATEASESESSSSPSSEFCVASAQAMRSSLSSGLPNCARRRTSSAVAARRDSRLAVSSRRPWVVCTSSSSSSDDSSLSLPESERRGPPMRFTSAANWMR
mmetsp:Transcript_8213/g.26984  ORF Transcript_8213/g.26984 Transcript_8213/m.26984 type:complete len:514 (-) Transcript_8213:1202-2743(-)